MNKKLRKILDKIIYSVDRPVFGEHVIVSSESIENLRLYLKIEDEKMRSKRLSD